MSSLSSCLYTSQHCLIYSFYASFLFALYLFSFCLHLLITHHPLKSNFILFVCYIYDALNQMKIWIKKLSYSHFAMSSKGSSYVLRFEKRKYHVLIAYSSQGQAILSVYFPFLIVYFVLLHINCREKLTWEIYSWYLSSSFLSLSYLLLMHWLLWGWAYCCLYAWLCISRILLSCLFFHSHGLV